MRVARYYGVPPWDAMIDTPYYFGLAIACMNVEAEVEDHQQKKARG